jgi:hypothetical protein
MHMTSHPSPENADPRRSVVESIDQYLKDGMPVFDETGKQVGDVRMYSSTAGYLMVNAEALRKPW